MSFWDHRKKIFSCIKQLIALRWSHTIFGKLETEFFDSCAWFVNLNRLNSLWKENSTFSDCNARCQTTWELWEHMANPTLGAIQSSTNVEQPTKNTEKKELKSGNIGSKPAEFVVGSGSIATFIHSLTLKKQHSRVRARGSKPQSKCQLLLVDTKVTAIFWNWQADVCFVH